MSQFARVFVAIATALALTLPPGTSAAGGAATPDASAEDGNRAVALAKEGRAAYEAQRFDEAYDKFAAANALVASPAFVLYMARARRGMGRLVEAREIYLRITSASLPADAPAIWRQADTDARAELSALATQLPSIVIDASGAPDGAALTLDGRAARAGESIDVDPGEHTAALSLGTRTERASATVRAGQRGVVLRVAWDAPTAPDRDASTTTAEPGAARRGSLVPGVVGLAVGGALLGAGAIVGLMALGKDGDVVDACPAGACGVGVDVADIASEQDAAGTMADVSTVLLVAGGAIAAAGVVLIVIRPGGDDAPATTAAVGPTGLVVRGGF